MEKKLLREHLEIIKLFVIFLFIIFLFSLFASIFINQKWSAATRFKHRIFMNMNMLELLVVSLTVHDGFVQGIFCNKVYVCYVQTMLIADIPSEDMTLMIRLFM